ncbi:MAG: type IV secretion system DotC family protein [Alphaproteobacteria bacterium]|nr:type IV secretion system DotC family protein [Alphaproteobacteria bacterium]
MILAAGLCGVPSVSYAQLMVDNDEPITDASQEPVGVDVLVNYKPKNVSKEKSTLPLDIRADALKEAALSFGARGGLARRTYEIRQQLDLRSRYLDKVFNFNQLLIAAPSGLLIEPPVITESMNAMLIDTEGQEAAVSDRIYNIIKNARIVSTARTWHEYLEREWGEVTPPPDILTPQDDEERRVWKEYVNKGWEFGYQQADDIFADDLAKLTTSYEGMVRYRTLLAQGMVSPPYALQVDRGITGGGSEMKIGDRAIQITGVPEFVPGSDLWKPANR